MRRRAAPSRARRHGVALAELVVSLALGGVLMGAAVRSLSQHLRLAREHEAQVRATAATRDALDVLRAELAHSGGIPRLSADTALELSSIRAYAPACDLVAGRPILPSGAWWSAPRAGDSLAVIDTLTGTEWRTTIAVVGSQRASTRCPDGGTRLALTLPIPATAVPFALPVRVWRVARYVLYRGSDALWWLGERGCAPVCGTAQPIAGPLMSPAQGGLRLSMRFDAAGRAQSIDVVLQASVNGRRAHLDARLPLPR